MKSPKEIKLGLMKCHLNVPWSTKYSGKLWRFEMQLCTSLNRSKIHEFQTAKLKLKWIKKVQEVDYYTNYGYKHDKTTHVVKLWLILNFSYASTYILRSDGWIKLIPSDFWGCMLRHTKREVLIKVLRHALFCHVCNRSLCIISVEAEMAEE